MSLHVHKTRETFLQCLLHECGGNFLQVESSSQILRSKKVFETMGPVDSEVSKMHEAEVHEAEVHVFSDSVPHLYRCRLPKSALNLPDIKFTRRWNQYLEQYTESARRIDGEQIQFRFHIFLGSKIDGQHFSPEDCPHDICRNFGFILER